MALPVPRSLFEMNLGGDDTGGWADALAQNRASLVGLGLGLASGGFQGALQGYGQGSQTDALAAYRRAQQQQHKADLAARQQQQAQEFGFRKSEAQRQADQWRQTFERGGESEFDRMQRDLARYRGTPQEEAIKQFYQNKLEPPKVEWQEDAAGNKIPYLINPRSPTAPVTPAPGFAQPGERPPITGPGGQVFTPPPGLSGAARKRWEADVAGTLADVATGKMTQEQANAGGYASAMEIAERQMRELEPQGLDPEGRAKERVPFGLGSYFQTNEYQNYRNARDAFVNAKLRRQSGATIRDDEFLREERIYFPQPGESGQQIRHKRALREDAVRQMRTAAGPGYKSPPVQPADTPAPAAATAGPGGITPEQARAELERRRKQGGR